MSKQDLSQEHSIQAQIDYYRNYISKRVRWQYAGIYFDKASGLKKDKRRGFKKMLDACKNGDVDQIIAKSISRFGRNTIDVLKTLRELKSMNIGVYFELENLDSLDNSQYLMIELIASIAQDEQLPEKIGGAHQPFTEYSLTKNMQDIYFKKHMWRIS